MSVDITAIGKSALGVAVPLFAIIFIVAIIGLAYYVWRKNKAFREFRCVIWEKNGFGQLQQTYDWAGIFIDKKTNNKRFFMQNNNVGLSPDNVPYVPSGRQNVVYLFRTGLKNFHYIKPMISNPTIDLVVGEEDVNWAINAYERQKKLFANNTLLQYLPYLSLVFVGLIVVMVVYFLVGKFDIIQEVSLNMRAAADSIAQAKAGTMVISP